MKTSLTFNFDNAGEAADFLEKLNKMAANGAVASAMGENDDDVPWTEDEPASAQTDSKGSSDPWADDAKPVKPAKAQTTAQHDAAGVLFPASGEYVKETPNGDRTWKFGVTGAPDCDCGYPAALVSGKKGNRKWEAYWCPIGFTKNFRDKCKFSEFA